MGKGLEESIDIFVSRVDALNSFFLRVKSGMCDSKSKYRVNACSRFSDEVLKAERFFDKHHFYDCCLENLVYRNEISAESLSSALIKSITLEDIEQVPSFSDNVEEEYQKYLKSKELPLELPDLSTNPLYKRAVSRNKALIKFLTKKENEDVMSDKEFEILHFALGVADNTYVCLGAMNWISNELKKAEYDSHARRVSDYIKRTLTLVADNVEILAK